MVVWWRGGPCVLGCSGPKESCDDVGGFKLFLHSSGEEAAGPNDRWAVALVVRVALLGAFDKIYAS